MSLPGTRRQHRGPRPDRQRASRWLTGLLLLAAAGPGLASMGVYQAPEEFIEEAFTGEPPRPTALWITPALREPINDILGHPPSKMRLRYWRRDGRTAWVVEEIGKEKPITTGIVIDEGRIERVKVLVFRESRGWEVRHDFFTDQFRDAALEPDMDLDRNIDGISGATLSVRAITRLARLTLFLESQVRSDGPS